MPTIVAKPTRKSFATLAAGDVLTFHAACGCFAPAGECAIVFSVSQHRDQITVSNVSGERKTFSEPEATTFFALFTPTP